MKIKHLCLCSSPCQPSNLDTEMGMTWNLSLWCLQRNVGPHIFLTFINCLLVVCKWIFSQQRLLSDSYSGVNVALKAELCRLCSFKGLKQRRMHTFRHTRPFECSFPVLTTVHSHSFTLRSPLYEALDVSFPFIIFPFDLALLQPPLTKDSSSCFHQHCTELHNSLSLN